MKKKEMILKVQQSLTSSDNIKTVLMYNEDKSFYYEESDPSIVDPVIEYMGDRPKVYFKASVDDKIKEIDLIKEVEITKW